MSSEQPAPASGRPRDWLDDILDADTTPPPKPEPQPAPPQDADTQPQPWWSLRSQERQPDQPPAPSTTPVPGVHITVNQPQPQPVHPHTPDRRARARRWLLLHGAAAGAGWSFGFYHSLTALLNTLGPGGAAAGLAVAGGSWFAAEMVTERYVTLLPSRTRPPVIWALRIPFATALLATALHAPNALI